MKQTILYLECNSGISGDMTVGALLDLGADPEALKSGLDSLPLSGYTVQISEVYKSGLRACDFNVILDQDNHDHDMEYLHGHAGAGVAAEPAFHDHVHGPAEHPHRDPVPGSEEHPHHDPVHGPAGHVHAHHHADARNLRDILDILERSRLTDGARSLAARIFTVLAQAEAQVHGKPVDEVHFHEVGAVDSIVDIAAAAICIDSLKPDQIVVSPLTDGTGTIRCQHGLIPVPVPAVSAIAAAHGLPLRIRPIEGELVTPTGAAIAAAVRTSDILPEEFRILRTGLGAGKRDYAATGVLRAMLLEPVQNEKKDSILKLETNIDDCTGEALSFTLSLLLEAGALDVYYTPIYMKKNRPAWMLTVLCPPALRPTMEAIIIRNTTTIGIRVLELERTRLEREILPIETPWGTADVKFCRFENETYCYPESDSVCRLARKEQVGFGEMYRRIQACATDGMSS